MKLGTAIGSLALAMLACSGAQASASDVVSLVGDKDGFGIGVVNGQGFDFSLIGPPDVQDTDTWISGDLAVVHDYVLPVGATSATLELFTGGQGLDGLSSVYLNDVYVGQLTDGDGIGPLYNYAWLDSFDLTPHLALLTGHDTVEVRTFDPGDGWVLDYSQITISAVPEPGTAMLFCLGIAALGRAARRRCSS